MKERNLMDYKFHVGDEVITVEGVRGKITKICNCDKCAQRGFYEPEWEDEIDKWPHYITIYEAENNFNGYYKIGTYHFNEFDKAYVLGLMADLEDALKTYRRQLKVIEEQERLEE